MNDTAASSAGLSPAPPDDAARSWTLAIDLQDLTEDLLPVMYLANDLGPDQVPLNRSRPGRVRLVGVIGARDLLAPTSKVLGYDSFKGMGGTFAYRDGRRLPMIVVSDITSPFALQESNLAFAPRGGPSALRRGRRPYRHDNDGEDGLSQATGFLKGERPR